MFRQGLLISLILIHSSFALTGYDCTHPNSEQLSISTYKTLDCHSVVSHTNTTSQYIQVLNTRKHTQIHTKSCVISKSSLIWRCGAFSHSLLVTGSLTVLEPISISAEDCDDLHRTGKYKTFSGTIISNIKVGTTTTAKVVDIGSVDSTGECEGVTIVRDGITYSKSVQSSEYRIQIHDNKATLNIATQKVLFPEGFTCDYSRGSCASDTYGRRCWTVENSKTDCGDSQYNLLYEGWANATQSVTSPLVFTVETSSIRFALAVTTPKIICGHTGYLTEDDDLFVLTGRPNTMPHHHTIASVVDYDTFLDTNLKFVFVERNIQNRTTELYDLFNTRYCELNKSYLRNLLSLARRDPEEFAWVYTKKPGYTATLRGEVIHLVKCQGVAVSPRRTEDCYNEMPVLFQNSSYFLRPSTRILVKYGTPVPCSPLAPVLYMVDGVWVKVGGEPYIAPSPTELSPDAETTWSYGDIKTLHQIGFLSRDQVQNYRNAILGNVENEAIQSIFIGRVVSGGSVTSQGLNFNSGIETDDLVDKVTDTVISKLYGIWDFVVRHLGAILGFAILWDGLCVIISALLHGWLLFKKFGFTGILLAAFWSSLAKHLLYSPDGPYLLRRWKRKQLREANTELVEIPDVKDTPETSPDNRLSKSNIYPPLIIDGR